MAIEWKKGDKARLRKDYDLGEWGNHPAGEEVTVTAESVRGIAFVQGVTGRRFPVDEDDLMDA